MATDRHLCGWIVLLIRREFGPSSVGSIQSFQAITADISDSMGDAIAMGLRHSMAAKLQKGEDEKTKQVS